MSRTLGSCNLSTAQQQRGSIIQDSTGTVELLVYMYRQVWSTVRMQLQAYTTCTTTTLPPTFQPMAAVMNPAL